MPGLMKKDKRRKQPRARRPGCFEVQERAGQLAKMGGPRVGWKARIDWEAFRPELERVHDKARKSAAGAKPSDVVLMFKMLGLQRLHNLADEKVEYLVRDRRSFMRFWGLELEDRVPDGNSVWLFRERLKALGLFEVLFKAFHGQLAARGSVARSGQMIGAAFVASAQEPQHARGERADQGQRGRRGSWAVGGRAGQARAERHRCALDEEERASAPRVQEPRQRGSRHQAHRVLRGHLGQCARQPGV